MFRLPRAALNCYYHPMWRDCHIRRKTSKPAAFARGLLAAAVFLASALQGVTLCLCAPDPDGCGEHCHDCGSAAEPQTSIVGHVCEHLTVSALQPADKVTAATAKSSGAPLQTPSPHGPQTGAKATLGFNGRARPPGVLSPQFTFIAHSAQMLC